MNYYELIGVPSNAPPSEITAAYVRQIKAGHNGLTLKDLDAMYEVLTDFAKRREYDRQNDISPSFSGGPEPKSPAEAMRARSRRNMIIGVAVVVIALGLALFFTIRALIAATNPSQPRNSNGITYPIPAKPVD